MTFLINTERRAVFLCNSWAYCGSFICVQTAVELGLPSVTCMAYVKYAVWSASSSVCKNRPHVVACYETWCV